MNEDKHSIFFSSQALMQLRNELHTSDEKEGKNPLRERSGWLGLTVFLPILISTLACVETENMGGSPSYEIYNTRTIQSLEDEKLLHQIQAINDRIQENANILNGHEDYDGLENTVKELHFNIDQLILAFTEILCRCANKSATFSSTKESLSPLSDYLTQLEDSNLSEITGIQNPEMDFDGILEILIYLYMHQVPLEMSSVYNNNDGVGLERVRGTLDIIFRLTTIYLRRALGDQWLINIDNIAANSNQPLNEIVFTDSQIQTGFDIDRVNSMYQRWLEVYQLSIEVMPNDFIMHEEGTELFLEKYFDQLERITTIQEWEKFLYDFFNLYTIDKNVANLLFSDSLGSLYEEDPTLRRAAIEKAMVNLVTFILKNTETDSEGNILGIGPAQLNCEEYLRSLLTANDWQTMFLAGLLTGKGSRDIGAYTVGIVHSGTYAFIYADKNEGQLIATLPPGTVVPIIDQTTMFARERYIKIYLPSGEIGYISKNNFLVTEQTTWYEFSGDEHPLIRWAFLASMLPGPNYKNPPSGDYFPKPVFSIGTAIERALQKGGSRTPRNLTMAIVKITQWPVKEVGRAFTISPEEVMKIVDRWSMFTQLNVLIQATLGKYGNTTTNE